jgi:hypothetical protein
MRMVPGVWRVESGAWCGGASSIWALAGCPRPLPACRSERRSPGRRPALLLTAAAMSRCLAGAWGLAAVCDTALLSCRPCAPRRRLGLAPLPAGSVLSRVRAGGDRAMRRWGGGVGWGAKAKRAENVLPAHVNFGERRSRSTDWSIGPRVQCRQQSPDPTRQPKSEQKNAVATWEVYTENWKTIFPL